MVTSRPTASELTALEDAFRRDPASSFTGLANCLLQLGRANDAVQTCARGLNLAPENLEGRLYLGQALAALHRWKEAQTELLRVVKADRNNQRGFRMLGEVLMRRNDFERALPVLQHAQNLNPSDSELLGLVRRARDGQALDPPPPIPTPVEAMVAGAAFGESEFDLGPELPLEAPTKVAASRPAMVSPLAAPSPSAPPSLPLPRQARASAPPAPAPPALAPLAPAPPAPAPSLARLELSKQQTPVPSDRISSTARGDGRGNDAMAFAPVEHHVTPPPENPLAPLASGVGAGQPGTAATVRPRLISASKPKDAAQEGLRVSAAAGEQYLNQLLLGGLLEVPNVRVEPPSYETTSGKRWGRSASRIFVYLFVLLLAGGAGSGAWYWYAQKQVDSDIARYLENAKTLAPSGAQADLVKAGEQARKALERNTSDPHTMAVLAEVTSLSGLLYGEYSPQEVQRAIGSAEQKISEASKLGYRELVIARSANALSELPGLSEGADAHLAAVHTELEAWLERSPDDHLARWLLGRVLLAAGNRSGAKAAFTQAHAGGEGPAIATVALANFHLDEGEFDSAMTLYDAALSRSQNHALAFVGRSLARSERRIDAQDAMADISIGLTQASGVHLVAWKELATATASQTLGDYEAFGDALNAAAKSTGPQQPRFLARLGLARIAQGRIVDAAGARSAVRWYAADPQSNPLVTLLDVELLLARGLPQAALDALEDASGGRVALARGRAYFDLGNASKALASFQEALKTSPDDIELQAWTEAAIMVSNEGSIRNEADEALDSLGRKATTKTARYVHGMALARIGKSSLAEEKLSRSVDDMSAAFPNPLAYRSFLELGRIAYKRGKTDVALEALREASKANPGYLPTRDLLGQVLVESDPTKALENLADVINAGVASVGAELALARALTKTGGSKEDATAAIRRAQERGASTAALQAVIAEVDSGLFAELGVPAP